MSDTPTEKLLPQGLQDMLSAHRKYTSQANDINNEIIDREMKTLHLPLKAKWYEMIESLIKGAEYRGIPAYWIVRLFRDENGRKISRLTANFLARNIKILKWWIESGKLVFKPFDFVKFSYGYTRRTMTFEIESITIGKGNPEWGAPTEDVFIIKLGKRV